MPLLGLVDFDGRLRPRNTRHGITGRPSDLSPGLPLRAGTSLIDLVPATAPTPPGAGNMDHFAVRVEAYDPAVLGARLRRLGIDPGEVHERYGAEGYGPSLYITDPDGNTLELKGPATRGL